MSGLLNVPGRIASKLEEIDAEAPLEVSTIQHRLMAVANEIDAVPEEERAGQVAEITAFEFNAQSGQQSEWGTHFGPIMTGVHKNGVPFSIPDIGQLGAATIDHWIARAKNVSNPVLKARYADLAWDLARAVRVKPEFEMAGTAIAAYLAAIDPKFCAEMDDRLHAAERALDLAIQIKDDKLTAEARARLVDLHEEGMKEPGRGWWWIAPQRLLGSERVGLTEQERARLVNSLEGLLSSFSNVNDLSHFNPHSLKDVAGQLKKHYRRHGSNDDLRRLNEAVARAFEAAANIGKDAIVEPSFLQTAFEYFKKADLEAEAKRVRLLMEAAIERANAAMSPVGMDITVKRDDIDQFLKGVIVESWTGTLVLVAKEFLLKEDDIVSLLKELRQRAPLQYMLSMNIHQDNHVAAVIGSLDEDPVGRTIHQADMKMDFAVVWLMRALEEAVDRHGLTANHLSAWVNRKGMFADIAFLREGFAAWLVGDSIKAVHVLVPQVEAGLRAIAETVGLPVTKPHPVTKGASVAVNMGDLLSKPEMREALGPDITLHFRTLYADPRGRNLRNRVAHGLISATSLDPHVARLVVHSFLVLAVWQELAEARRKQSREKAVLEEADADGAVISEDSVEEGQGE